MDLGADSAGSAASSTPLSFSFDTQAYFVTSEWDLNWLCVLLNEADVMASASARYGPELGESLAQEWRLIDFQPHTNVASTQGRLKFLKQLLFSSPASSVLGLNQRISDEIRSAS